eukprot:TRINITY_DN3085_c0_g1_i1.p1 TRINITY_DN3085_c0_g1~~TRINITY_DN3085_c0_g1_i1.p1  ORF type:complete len:263 (-),score=34.04 TRINITY_DN3085_c0_g1_i1:42-830(-)
MKRNTLNKIIHTRTLCLSPLYTCNTPLTLRGRYHNNTNTNYINNAHNLITQQILFNSPKRSYSTSTNNSHSIKFCLHTPLQKYSPSFVHSRHFGLSKFLGSIINDPEVTAEKTHKEKKVLKFSPEKVFQVVSSVEQYSSFLPWCKRSTILKKKQNFMEAALSVGVGVVEEEYVSNVQLEPNKKVVVSVPPCGLFEHLTTVWEFENGPTPNTCLVNFSLSFKLKQSLHAKIINSMFTSAVESMVKAFEDRCYQIYGDPKKKKI